MSLAKVEGLIVCRILTCSTHLNEQDMIQGAETTLYATLSDELEKVSGLYLENNSIKEPSKMSQDRGSQDRLWDLTSSFLRPWLTTDPEQLVNRVT